MKERYMAPEAEIIRFVAEEELAAGSLASNVSFDVLDQADGDWKSWEKWFG